MADATTTSTQTPNQQLTENYGYLSDQAKALQQQGHVPYTGELVPELNQGQKDAIQQISDNSNAAAVGYATAQGTTTGAINDINANKNVYQPYFNSALSATNNALNQATTNANLAQSGYNTAQGNTANAYANTLANANLAQPGYNTAQGTTTSALNANQNAANLGLSGYNTAQGNTANAYANTLANANAAQPGYQTAFGSADAAGNIIAAGKNVAQPYMASAQNMANAAMPGYGEAASAATAGMTPLEQATYAAQPAYQHAMAGTDAASQGYNAANYQSGIQGYLSPYLQSVVNATAAQMQNINQQQQQQMLGSAIGSGAFGGDRANIGLGALQNQQNLALGQTIGGLLQSGYQNAAQNYMTGLQQQGVLANQYGQLGGQAQQALINAGLAREQGAANIANIAGQRMTGATQYGALGTAAQNAALQGAGLEQANAALYGQLATGKQNALMQASAQQANIANQQAAQANAQQLAAQQSAALTGQLGAQQGSLAGAQQTAALQGALQQANIANQQGTLAGQQQTAAMEAAKVEGALGSQYGTLGSAAQNAALAAPTLGLQAGAQQGSLAGTAQASSIAGANAALGANTVALDQKQKIDAANYAQKMAEQAYPIQMLNEAAGIMYGAPNMGSTSTTTTPVGNDISSLLGFGTTALGLLSASDERLKDNMHPIGKSFDGQTIYRFNYKGDPRTQVGLSAQEVEKHHPSSVYKTKEGIRLVDYDQATHHAAERGHFHLGGSASMGGLVPESMERHHYLKGGEIGAMPYIDDPLMDSMLEKSGLGLASYIPKHDKFKSDSYELVSPPNKYTPEKMDLSGVGGFLNAGKNFFAPSTSRGIIAGDNPNLYSAPIGPMPAYADGGMVPRTYHADGEDTPTDDRKTVSADTFGGLGGIIPAVFNKGQPLSDDARMSILAAGLGMMGGTSPNAMVNIGQGGLTGLNTYANQKKMQYDYQKAQAEQDIGRRRVAVEEAGIPLRASEVASSLQTQKLATLAALQQKAKSYLTGPNGRVPDDLQRSIDNILIELQRGSPIVPGVKYPDTLSSGTKVGPQSLLRSGSSDGIELTSSSPANVVPKGMKIPGEDNVSLADLGDKKAVPASAKQEAEQNGFTLPVSLDPDILLQDAENAANAGYGDIASEKQKRALDITNEITHSGGLMIHGQFAPLPNYAEQMAARKAMETKATEETKSGFELVDIQLPDGTTVQIPKSEALKRGYITKSISPAEIERQKENVKSGFELVDVMQPDGSTIKMPKSEVLKAGQITSSLPAATIEGQKLTATENAKRNVEAGQFITELPAVQQIQDGLINAYTKIDMNRSTPLQADVIGTIKSFPALDNTLKRMGIDVDKNGFQGMADAAAKDAITDAFRQLAATASARTTNMQLKETLMSVAEPTKAPAAKYQVITQQKARLMQQEDMYRDWNKVSKNENWNQFIDRWSSDPQHSPDVYMQKAVDKIPYFKGMGDADIGNLQFKREGSAGDSSAKTVLRTGKVTSGQNAGKTVIEYSDGTREYR